MNTRITDLEELCIEDLEENDSLLIWDASEQTTKKVSFQTLMSFIEFMNEK